MKDERRRKKISQECDSEVDARRDKLNSAVISVTFAKLITRRILPGSATARFGKWERDRGKEKRKERRRSEEMIFGKERTRGRAAEKNRELRADIKARQTIRRDADAIVLRLVDRRSIVSSRSAHSIPLSRSPEYSYRVISSEHPSKVARSLIRVRRGSS